MRCLYIARVKNQYVGDQNDYVKYSLLARIAEALQHESMLVCWMLTGVDERPDGNKLAYLQQPLKFRGFDPDVFDALSGVLEAGVRDVALVERLQLIPNARYFPALLGDHADARASYFAALATASVSHDLMFFDPDNGLAVPSVPKGRRESARYLYWDELDAALKPGRTVVVYQHFPRVQRATFLERTLARVGELSAAHATSAIHTPEVAYIIAAAIGHVEALSAVLSVLESRWEGRLAVTPRGRTLRPNLRR